MIFDVKCLWRCIVSNKLKPFHIKCTFRGLGQQYIDRDIVIAGESSTWERSTCLDKTKCQSRQEEGFSIQSNLYPGCETLCALSCAWPKVMHGVVQVSF